MTCGYGLRRTCRTLTIGLRIRRLGVRVPPSAPRSTAPSEHGRGSFANAVANSAVLGGGRRSRLPGGTFTVRAIVSLDLCARIEVQDNGSLEPGNDRSGDRGLVSRWLMPFSRQIRSNSTSAGRGLMNRPVNTVPLSVSTSSGTP